MFFHNCVIRDVGQELVKKLEVLDERRDALFLRWYFLSVGK